jgi:hypothetical protein
MVYLLVHLLTFVFRLGSLGAANKKKRGNPLFFILYNIFIFYNTLYI